MSLPPTDRPLARVVSFRSRRDALTARQQRAWDTWWPSRGAHVDDVVTAGGLDTRAWFGRTAPLVLEVGCGTGVATAALAESEPGLDVLAVDVYRPGLAQLLAACDERGVGSVRVLHGDAVPLLAEGLAPGSLTAVRVFFPDPWPKQRHHKRRLLSRATLGLVASRLRPGGVLHVATDVADYAAFTRAEAAAVPELVDHEPGADAPVRLDRPETKFERRAGAAGSAVTEIVLRRRS
ncbi:tRNA (guanosine(46)-N7)-methyltransferase TrmB [Rhodococcus aerolatus]